MADSRTRRRTKVERVLETYDLEGWGERLEAAWTGEGADRTSLRELATEFNHAILRAALDDAGGGPVLDADVEATYEVLADGSGGAAAVEKRRELERAGVDVDALERDFVSHQAVHTYLRRVRDAAFDRDDEDRLERKTETVRRLVGRTRAVTESTVVELVTADLLADREYDAVVDLRVVCRDCGRDFAVEELFERGGCDCD